jgi:hypothetical protein
MHNTEPDRRLGWLTPTPPPHPPSQRIFGLEKIPPQPTQTRESDVCVSRPDILVMVSSTRTVLPAAILKNRTSGRSKRGPGLRPRFRSSGSGLRPFSARNAFPVARYKGPHSAATTDHPFRRRFILQGLCFRPGSVQECASGQAAGRTALPVRLQA